MTTLQLRMREELVRRDFSESTIRTYLQAWRLSGGGQASGSTIWDPRTCAGTRCICLKSASWPRERSSCISPRSDSSTCACSSAGT